MGNLLFGTQEKRKKQYKSFKDANREFEQYPIDVMTKWAKSIGVLESQKRTVSDSLDMPDIPSSKMDIPNQVYPFVQILAVKKLQLKPPMVIDHIEILDYGIQDDEEEQLLQHNLSSSFTIKSASVNTSQNELTIENEINGTAADIHGLAYTRTLILKLKIWGCRKESEPWKEPICEALQSLKREDKISTFLKLYSAFESLLLTLIPDKKKLQKLTVKQKLDYIEERSLYAMPVYVHAFRLARNDLIHQSNQLKAQISMMDLFIFICLLNAMKRKRILFDLPTELNISAEQPTPPKKTTKLIQLYSTHYLESKKKEEEKEKQND